MHGVLLRVLAPDAGTVLTLACMQGSHMVGRNMDGGWLKVTTNHTSVPEASLMHMLLHTRDDC